jgi:beta-phosphoglucomutase
LAIQRLGIEPSECLVIEDHERGLRAAAAAGARVLEVSSVDEVTFANIQRRIAECNEAASA